MLKYAKEQVGKPFSQVAMARSLVCPRKTNEKNWCDSAQNTSPHSGNVRNLPRYCLRFCAELVAAVLKKGGLIDPMCNPGAATPESIHSIYSTRAAVTGNPTLLRDASTLKTLTGGASVLNPKERELLISKQHVSSAHARKNMVGSFCVVAGRQTHSAPQYTNTPSVQLTLHSLDMSRPRGNV